MMPSQHIRQFGTVYNNTCRFLEQQTLWGQTVFCAWLLNQDAVVSVPRSTLRLLNTNMQPEEETEWSNKLQSAQQIVSEIHPLLIVYIIKGGTQ